MTDGPFCPKCLTVTLMRSDRYEGADECPECGAAYFGTFEASPERMAELRRKRLTRGVTRSNKLAARYGLILAALGVASLMLSASAAVAGGVLLIVLGWTAWKGRDL